MSVIIILLLISLVIASIFLIAYIWAVKSGQYDDTYAPAMKVFNDGGISKHKSIEKKNVTERSERSERDESDRNDKSK